MKPEDFRELLIPTGNRSSEHKTSLLTILFFVLALFGCTSSPTEISTTSTTPNNISTQSPSPLPPTITKASTTSIESSTEVRQPYPVNTEFPIIPQAYPYPPIYPTQTLIPTLIPSPTYDVSEPPETIDLTSPQSILHWVQYGLTRGDAKIFETLAYKEVGYGLYASEGLGYYTKGEFMDEIAKRLPNHPSCNSYEIHEGNISILYIFVTGWQPPWEYMEIEGSFTGLVLEFSNQQSENGEFFLTGAFGAFMLQAFPDPLPCP